MRVAFLFVFYLFEMAAWETKAADLVKTKPQESRSYGHATDQLHALLQVTACECFSSSPPRVVFI